MIVSQGEYSSEKVPVEDKEYIKGEEPIRMMNFKEIVIRSDEPTLQQFNNERWNSQRTGYPSIPTLLPVSFPTKKRTK